MTAPIHDLARAAADAVTQLCATLDDCAREVADRGGQRVARNALADDRKRAVRAFAYLSAAVYAMPACPPVTAACRELLDMSEGCQFGYVRPTWALRIMQIAAEVA